MADLSGWTSTGPSVYEIFVDHDTMVDPYPLYGRLLRERPVDTSAGPVALTRFADVEAALRHPGLSADDRHDNIHRKRAAAGELSPALLAMLERRSFLHRDPPDHTRLRRALGAALAPDRLDGLTPVIQRFVDDAVDRAAERAGGGPGVMELIGELAYPLPLAVACRLLGVAVEDHVDAPWWRSQLCADFEAPAVAGEDCADYSDSVQGKMAGYFDRVIAERRRAGGAGDDVVSALLAAERRGELSAAEVNDTCRLVLVAAHETTTDLIANGMLALLRHPDQLLRLRDEPALAGSAVDEVLRYDTPVQFTRRVAITDFELNGTPVNSGDMVLLWLGAAGRDPAAFPDPDRFDITREVSRHVGFGGGIHACLSAPIARRQGEIALGTLCRRLVDPTLTVDPPRYLPKAIHAIAELPVAFRDVRPR